MADTEYAQEGVQVAVVNTRAYDPTCTLHTVTRRTTTQIVLDNGERYSIKYGKPVGGRAEHKALRPTTDPTVVNILARAAGRAALDGLTAIAKPPQHPAFDGRDLPQILADLWNMRGVVDRAIGDVEALRQATGTPESAGLDPAGDL